MNTINSKFFGTQQAIELAIGSFILSTLFFIVYIFSNTSTDILIIAWPFAASTILCNLIMLVHLTDRFIHLTQYRREIGFKILLLLSNIPITFLYYLIVMKL